MTIDVVITADGQIGVFVQDGSYADGAAAVSALLDQIGLQVPLSNRGAVESHRPNAEQVEQLYPHSHTHLADHLGGQRHDP